MPASLTPLEGTPFASKAPRSISNALLAVEVLLIRRIRAGFVEVGEYETAPGVYISSGAAGLFIPIPTKPFEAIRIRSTEFVENMRGSADRLPNSIPEIVG